MKRTIKTLFISVSSFLAVTVLTMPLCAEQAVPAQPQTQNQPASQQPAQPQPVSPPAQAPQPQAAQPAQPQPVQAPVQAPQPQPQTGFFQLPAAPVNQAPAKKGDISFNFDDADVFSVIQTVFGEILKVNYIVDPRVKGRVNFRSVSPIAKEDVLSMMEVILRLNGIGIVEDSGLYRIVPISDISREPAQVTIGRAPESVQITGKAVLQVVPVHYIQSTEMVRILTPFLSVNAVLVDVPRSNHVVIVDTDANVQRLLQLVAIFDSSVPRQVKPQVFVYPVQNGKAKDIATLLQQIFLGSKAPAKAAAKVTTAVQTQPAAPQPQVSVGAAGGEALVSDVTRIFPDEVANTIIILGTPEDYALVADAIQKIDIVPRQVMIEGLIVQVNLTDNMSFGLSWSLNTDLKITNIKPFTRDVNLTGDMTANGSGLSDSSTSNKGFTFVGKDPTGTIRSVISALSDESKTKLLAAPHILVSDNKEAKIQVGSQVPIATSTTTTSSSTSSTTTSGNTTTNTIQYKDIGIILKVKPQINDSGLISLEITQEVSAVGSNATIGGLSYSSFEKTETATNLVAQDGDTIIIGGLIREDVSKTKDGLPFLSKIPIIGNLFGNTADNNTRKEMIILLTPHVVKNQVEARDVSSGYMQRLKGIGAEVEKLTIKKPSPSVNKQPEDKKDKAEDTASPGK